MTRVRLPDERPGITRCMDVGPGLRVVTTINRYPEGRLGELWLKVVKGDQTIAGLLDMASIAASLYLQHGGAPAVLFDKWRAMRFPPDGFTGRRDFPMVSSIADYVGKWGLAVLER